MSSYRIKRKHWHARVAPFFCFAATLSVLLPLVGCTQPNSLRVYCAASFRPNMERLARQFKQETGIEIQLQLGGSNMLLSQIELSNVGDVFLPAESWYLEQAQEKQLAGDSQMLGKMHGVLISQQEADASKTNLAGWLQEKPKFSFALPEVAAIGRVTQQSLISAGQWEPLHKLVVTQGVYRTTVTEVANDVAMGTVDVGIVWNVVAKRYESLNAYELPELAEAEATVAIACLKTSQQPELAKAFVDFVVHSDFSQAEWNSAGLEKITTLAEQPTK